MLKILHEADDPELMEKVWSFRYERFVLQLGWEELRRPDQRERDEFDTAETIHAVLVSSAEVVGYSRLLPSNSPHLTLNFGRCVGIDTPTGPSIFEWSRCATAISAPRLNGLSASDLLMTGVLECLIEVGAQAVVFLTYPAISRMMRRRGYPIRKLGSLMLPSGDTVDAVTSKLPYDLLDRHRHNHGITGSLLEWGTPAVFKPRKPPAAA
jgi:acyl-homoserine lactone synthase